MLFKLGIDKKKRHGILTEKRNTLKWKHTCGMYSNNGVKNKRAQPIMIPETSPDKPLFAPLS